MSVCSIRRFIAASRPSRHFDGGRLTADQVDAIRRPADELKSHRFVTLSEASERVRPSMARRLAACLEAVKTGRTTYLEFGRIL